MRSMMQCLLIVIISAVMALITHHAAHHHIPFRIELIMRILAISHLILAYVRSAEHCRRVSLRPTVPLQLDLVQQALSDDVVPAVLVLLIINVCTSLLASCLPPCSRWLIQLTVILTLILKIIRSRINRRICNLSATIALVGFSLTSIYAYLDLVVGTRLINGRVDWSGFFCIVSGNLLLCNNRTVHISLTFLVIGVETLHV